MKLTVGRDRLAEALAIAERAAAARESTPILSGVRLRARDGWLCVTATDLEVTAELRMGAEVSAPGERVVDARLFAALVRRLPGPPVTLELGEDGSSLLVGSGSAFFSLLSASGEDFPELPEVGEGWTVRLVPRKLKQALLQTAFAAAPADQRPALSGVLLELEGEVLRLVATDGSRLAYREVPLEEPARPVGSPGLFPPRCILPSRAVGEVGRLCDLAAGETGAAAALTLGSRLASLEVEDGEGRLVTRLVEGGFPPYRQVFLEGLPTRVVFDRRVMLEAVQRASVLTRRGPAVVVLEAGAEGLTVRAREAEVGQGQEYVPARVEGPPVSTAYQAPFLEEVLKAFDVEEMVLELGDPARQGTVRAPSDEGYRYIIMPVRLG